jgi:hypothetical protein
MSHGSGASVVQLVVTTRWRVLRGSPAASQSTRSSPPQPGHHGEVAGQGGATRSSTQWWVNGERGGSFINGVPVMGSSSGGDGGGGDVLEHREVNRG